MRLVCLDLSLADASAAETCELHHAGRTQLAEELEAVKALRVEASVAVAEAKAACVSAQDQAGEVCTVDILHCVLAFTTCCRL